MTYCVVVSTTSNIEEAKHIARGLVKNKLAACTNIINNVTSVYYWKDEVHEDAECVLFIKTQKALFDKVRDFIVENHSYTLPEVIMLPIETGLDRYLNWVKENTL
jgi:periplasmic divalent cation tolerance protein